MKMPLIIISRAVNVTRERGHSHRGQEVMGTLEVDSRRNALRNERPFSAKRHKTQAPVLEVRPRQRRANGNVDTLSD